MRVPRLVIAIFAALVCTAALSSAPAYAVVTTVPAFSGSVVAPMYVTSPPGDPDRLFVVTRPGVIYVAVNGVLQSTPFLDIHDRVWQAGEAGMLSMAFHPGYSDPASAGHGLFYVYFVQKPGIAQANGPIHVEEFSADPDANVASDAAPRLVLEIPHNDDSHHYGGMLQFSPNDGLLYIGTGDGGGSDNEFGHAQDVSSQLGKLLRIDPTATAASAQMVAHGLRNPFRGSFDSATGDVTIGDVGQNRYEEVNYVPAGATLVGTDFGWPCREGASDYKPSAAGCGSGPFVDPVAGYDHASLSGPVAITGGVVVRDPALTTLFGRYLYADFYQGKVRSLKLATPAATDERFEPLPQIKQLVSFGEDGNGHVYAVSLTGTVSKLVCDQGTCDPPTEENPRTDPPLADPGTQPPAEPVPPTDSRDQPVVPTDSRAPQLRAWAGRTQNVLRRGRVRLAIACDEACTVRVTASAHGVALRGALRRLAARERTLFELRVAKRALHALVKRGAITIAIRARDAAGNLAGKRLVVRVKR